MVPERKSLVDTLLAQPQGVAVPLPGTVPALLNDRRRAALINEEMTHLFSGFNATRSQLPGNGLHSAPTAAFLATPICSGIGLAVRVAERLKSPLPRGALQRPA